MKRVEHSDHHRVFGDPEQVRNYYRNHAKRTDKLARRYAQRLSELGFKGGKILDAGCGYGGYCVEFAKAFPAAEVTGIDLSEPMLEMGRKLAEEAGVSDRVRFLKEDVEKMPFPGKSFDAVLSVNMFHHVAGRTAMVNEIERVLKPGGILLLADIRRSWLGYFMHPFRSAFTVPEAEDELKKTSLRKWRMSSGFLWWGIEAGGKE